jgi:class 3 adenylate cyclase
MGENSLIGPDVNFIFRMEKLAGALKEICVLSAPAATHLKAFGPVRSLGQHPLPGFGGTHEVYAF